MPDGLSSKVTVHIYHLMRELRHHCNKIATRNMILIQGNSALRKPQLVKDKAVNAPIKFEKIVIVVIKGVIGRVI